MGSSHLVYGTYEEYLEEEGETDDKKCVCPECGCKMCTYEEIYLTKKQVLEGLGIE